MVRQVMTRSQRRMEKKQALTIWALALAVSLVSFTLGVFVGRHTLSPSETVVQEVILPEPPPMHPIAPKGRTPGSSSSTEDTSSSALTFYETLSKGEPTPLGSGINLPPDGVKEATQSLKEVSKPPNTTPPPSQSSPKAVPHILQAASFASVEDARKLAERLGAMGFTCTVETADLGSKGIWYRVLVGPYPSKEAAESAGSLLKAEAGLVALVRKH